MKVFMYALSTCPWCRKAKQFFKENDIPFDFVDYDLQPEAEQEKIMKKMAELSGATSFPVVLIGEKVVVGYNPQKYAEILGTKKGRVA
jgi:glutaredoxin